MQTFVNNLRYFILKHQEIDNRSCYIYIFSHTETCFYTFSD